jgi:hypothetical protein
MLLAVLLIVLTLALAASVPVWRYSRGWGYYPSGAVGVILLLLLALRLEGKL